MLVTYYNIGAATATLRTKVAKKWQTMAAATDKSTGDSQKVPVRPVAVGQGATGTDSSGLGSMAYGPMAPAMTALLDGDVDGGARLATVE